MRYVPVAQDARMFSDKSTDDLDSFAAVSLPTTPDRHADPAASTPNRFAHIGLGQPTVIQPRPRLLGDVVVEICR